MNRQSKVLFALSLLLATSGAHAACTASPRQCVGTLSEVYIDNGGDAYVVPSSLDVATLASGFCTTINLPDGTSSGNALRLRRSNPSFDQDLQLLLIARSSFLSAKITVTTFVNVLTFCEISDVSL